jgi:hypothetical protein
LLQREGGKKWDEHRVQLVWDAIVLHTNFDIAKYKQLEVTITSAGTAAELLGLDIGKQVFVRSPSFQVVCMLVSKLTSEQGDLVTVTQSEWDTIAAEYPRPGLREYVKDTFVQLCTMKPLATYNNLAGDWGDKYVPGYSRVGYRAIDLVEALPE